MRVVSVSYHDCGNVHGKAYMALAICLWSIHAFDCSAAGTSLMNGVAYRMDGDCVHAVHNIADRQ